MSVDRETLALRNLEPVHLLGHLYYGFDAALRYHCGPIRDRYRRRGDDIADAQCANCDREVGGGEYPIWAGVSAIAGHPTTEWLRERLAKAGIRSKFERRDENDDRPTHQDGPAFGVETDARILRTVRKMAKQDLGIVTQAASAEFDRRFNLWFNQNYAYDCSRYAALFPKEHWPSPADGWLGLKEDFDRMQAGQTG